MRTLQEKVERENFIEMAVNDKDISYLKDFMILSTSVFIEGIKVNIGIRLELDGELDEVHGDF